MTPTCLYASPTMLACAPNKTMSGVLGDLLPDLVPVQIACTVEVWASLHEHDSSDDHWFTTNPVMPNEVNGSIISQWSSCSVKGADISPANGLRTFYGPVSSPRVTACLLELNNTKAADPINIPDVQLTWCCTLIKKSSHNFLSSLYTAIHKSVSCMIIYTLVGFLIVL